MGKTKLETKSKTEKKSKKSSPKKKRILYPWVKNSQSRCYKCALALVADRIGFEKVLSGDTTIGKFFSTVNDKVDKLFPSMYSVVAKHYKENGREISKKEFRVITIGRLRMMFKINDKKVEKLKEHPENNKDVFNKSIKLFNKIMKRKMTYDEYRNSKKKK